VEAVDEITPEPEFFNTPAVVNELNVGADENVWTPVNVCKASVSAIEADVDGNVIVVESVPVRVSELFILSNFPLE
jgi:hypothetical protein